MRMVKLIPWSVCTVILATFIFLFPYLISYYYVKPQDSTFAARTTLLPLLIFQGLIMMLKGTFSVASGITQEASEGTLDYQRLTPMTPLTKIVGYLFGLPIREYFLFLLTIPFTAYASFVGKLPFASFAQVYAVFFSAVLLYHMTGFFAGTVVKRKTLAGVLSQVLILVIYWILPNLSFVGYAVFEHLTLYPVVYQQIGQLIPEMAQNIPKLKDTTAYFYQWQFNPAPFSMAVQLSLAFLFAVVIHRKWRDPNHHLLGKNFALLTYSAVTLVLLGTTAPLIKSGMIFFSQIMLEMELGRRFGNTAASEEALAATGLFALITSIVGLLIVTIITPSVDSYQKGIRRQNKLQIPFQLPFRDSSTGLWHSITITLIGSIIWCSFTQLVAKSSWISGAHPLSQYIIPMLLGFSLPIIVCQLIIENNGKRSFFLWIVFTWVLPLFTAIVLAIIPPGNMIEIAIFISSLSGFSLLFLSATEAYDLDLAPYDRVVSSALTIGITFQAIIMIAMLIRFFLQKRQVKRRINQQTIDK